AWRDGVQRDGENKPLVSWEVYVVVNQPIPGAPEGGRRRRFVQVRGVEEPARSAAVHGLTLHPGGEWFSAAAVQSLPGGEGVDETAVQALVGEGIARELGRDKGKRSLEVG